MSEAEKRHGHGLGSCPVLGLASVCTIGNLVTNFSSVARRLPGRHRRPGRTRADRGLAVTLRRPRLSAAIERGDRVSTHVTAGYCGFSVERPVRPPPRRITSRLHDFFRNSLAIGEADKCGTHLAGGRRIRNPKAAKT